jgi:hypothetical protein
MMIVPVGCRSSDNETVSFDEKHQSPDQICDMESEENLYGGSHLEVLEGILMFLVDWGSEGVKSQCLEHP